MTRRWLPLVSRPAGRRHVGIALRVATWASRVACTDADIGEPLDVLPPLASVERMSQNSAASDETHTPVPVADEIHLLCAFAGLDLEDRE
jgi:hypothetical protein